MYVIPQFVEAEKQALALVECWDDLTDTERRESARNIALWIGQGTLDLAAKVQSGELHHQLAKLAPFPREPKEQF